MVKVVLSMKFTTTANRQSYVSFIQHIIGINNGTVLNLWFHLIFTSIPEIQLYLYFNDKKTKALTLEIQVDKT